MAVWTFKCLKCGSSRHNPLNATLAVICADCGEAQYPENLGVSLPESLKDGWREREQRLSRAVRAAGRRMIAVGAQDRAFEDLRELAAELEAAHKAARGEG